MTPAARIISVKRADVGTIAACFAAKIHREVRVTLRFNLQVDFIVLTDQLGFFEKPFPQSLNFLLLKLLDTLENIHILPPPKHEATHEIIAHILVGINDYGHKK
jgi:hypothetical protein